MELREMYEQFPADIRAKVKTNVENSMIYQHRKLSDSITTQDLVLKELNVKRATNEDLDDLKIFLNYAFNWTGSPEGGTFWLKQYNRIENDQKEALKISVQAKMDEAAKQAQTMPQKGRSAKKSGVR